MIIPYKKPIDIISFYKNKLTNMTYIRSVVKTFQYKWLDFISTSIYIQLIKSSIIRQINQTSIQDLIKEKET